ncbi:sterol desaturase family protein [Algiphilus sp.]|uniref:sterol desaturase family protein n=1 Tax=Algiphilus sp. TaxID=1872431 RepID=UPI003B51A703
MEFETTIRLALFVGGIAAFGWLERAYPRRPRTATAHRWPVHAGMALVGAAATALVPLGVAGAALWAQAEGIGLLQQFPLPWWLAVALAWLLLDAAIYWQHRLMHRFGWLWRWHRVHHTDTELDASSALRFHPGELLLSAGYKMAVVVLLGAPPLAVLLFEALLAFAALFNHANWALRPGVDRWLRRWLVTPDMHRVHHSTVRDETDSNFGNVLSIWDHLFGSYRAAPKDGQLGMRIGQDADRDPESQRLRALLMQPWRRNARM